MEEIQTLIADLTAEIDKVCAAIERLSDSQAQEHPSRLPGWSRAHVLVHLARNADGLRSLLLSARSGTPLRMYASPRTRSADIDAGVTRPADVIAADALEKFSPVRWLDKLDEHLNCLMQKEHQ